MKKLYIKTSGDDIDLIEIIADSLSELAEKTGHTVGTIKTYISKNKRGWEVVKYEK